MKDWTRATLAAFLVLVALALLDALGVLPIRTWLGIY